MSTLQGTAGEGAVSDRSAGSAGRAASTDERGEQLSILRVAADLYPAVTGGFPIHAHAMSKRQAEQGHDVTVLTADHGTDGEALSAERPYSVVSHRQLACPLGNSITPGIVLSLRRRLPAVDVVHAHSHLYFQTNVAAAMARLSDVPLVLTNHGLMSQTAPAWLQKLYIPTVGQFTFDAADRVLCYTETDRQRLRERNIDAPIDVVNNGVNCERFAPTAAATKCQLLYVGRLTDGKGIPTLLEGFAMLANTEPDLTLRIVGDGPDRPRYERRCERLGIADRVTFEGTVPNHELPRYYSESLLFVLPSHNEGLPRTVLEALACETPVVTSDLAQLESVVDGVGYTFERGSPTAMANTVGRLLESEDTRHRFGQRGRERVLRENAWTETVDETTDILTAVASASR